MDLTARIKEVLAAHQALGIRELQSAAVALRDQIVVADFAEHQLAAGSKPYSRSRISVDIPECEVLVMHWASQHACAPHDHGDSYGCLLVVAGQAVERLYRRRGRAGVELMTTRRHQAGDIVLVPRGVIHSMVNPTTSPLVTLHLYVPEITGMTVYDPTRCRKCIVSDDCGAWWPKAEEEVTRGRMS